MTTRSEIARLKVREAAAELLDHDGPSAVSIDAVARRSGVAKTTIYRHWANSSDLVVDTLTSRLRALPTPNTGSLRGDLSEYFRSTDSPEELADLARRLAALLYVASSDAGLAESMAALVHSHTTPVRTIVELARARGEIPPTIDVDVAIDIIHGPFLFGFLVSRRTFTTEYVDALINRIVTALTG